VKKCQHFGVCGGCDWQNLAYEEQLARKHARLDDLLTTALGPRAPVIDPAIGMRVDETGAPWEFRHKAAFVFGDIPGQRGAAIGHFAAHSRRIIPIVECPVHAERANRLAFELHDHLLREQIPAAGPSLRGVLRHLIVRTTRDRREAVAMLVVTRNDKSLRAPIRAFLGTEHAPDGFYLNIHDRPGPYMVGSETMRLGGRSHVRERVAGLSFLVSPTTFFQTNVEAAERLVNLVLEATPAQADRVLDLYAGSGLFTMPLAQRGHAVTAVEENAVAVKDAESNVRLNRLPTERVQLHASTVETALIRLRREAFELVVLDPPRSGCPPKVLRAVFGQLRPARILYVSCNPEALAAELRVILQYGYRISRVQPVDMFPHTTHIETFVILDRVRVSVSVRWSFPDTGEFGLARRGFPRP
jgi:23S rRNA (uracil1939-C5)-methyltransferase